MLDLIKTLQETPLPAILAFGGIIFLFLGIVGSIKQLQIEPLQPVARRWAAGSGALLLGIAIVLYVVPATVSSGTAQAGPTPTAAAAAGQPAPAASATPAADTPAPSTQAAGATPTLNAQGYQVTADPTGAQMVLIPAGNFLMGTQDGLGDELPVRPVVLTRPYWLDIYEVSNQQYQACVNKGTCPLPAALSSHNHANYFGNPDFANYPVVNVNWDMANAFCQKFRGGRLPTEAEWEFAARGSDQRPYPWGSTPPTCNLSNAATGPDSVCTGDTQPVTNYPAGVSPFGVFNMSGNAWEWVSDFYGPYSGLPTNDPAGNPAGSLHILRGGGWSSEPKNATTTVRYHLHSTDSNGTFGIRCARNS